MFGSLALAQGKLGAGLAGVLWVSVLIALLEFQAGG